MLGIIDKLNLSYRIFFLFIVFYGFILIVGANFSVIDDHGLLSTLVIGKDMPFFIMPEIGRFFPLSGYEWSILSNISISPIFFYTYNTLQFFIITFLIFKILENILNSNNKYINIYIILCLIFSPGFISAWLRLFVPERSELFFLIIFLYFFLKYQKEQKVIYLLIGLISANIALYYKEPAFLMLGSFAFLHLIFGWKEINFKQKIFDFLLMISSFIFILVYFFVVYLNKGETLYGTTTLNQFLQMAKNIFNMALSDPLIIFILLPLVLYRLYQIIKIRKIDYLFDSMLFSSAIYVLVYIKLNMFAHHYLLPSYAFGLIAISYFIFKEQFYKKVLFKILGIITLIFVLFSSLPTGLHLISHYKNVPNNFQKTLSFLQEYIAENSKDGEKVSIFFDGVNRNGGEVHHSFIKYLEFKGLNHNQFDIKSDENDNGILPIVAENSEALYTILKQSTLSEIKSGDLLIVTPYTAKYIGLEKKEMDKMSEKYALIYHAKSFLEIPNIGIKSIIKSIYRENKNYSIENRVMVSQNIFQMPLDFYVFKAR